MKKPVREKRKLSRRTFIVGSAAAAGTITATAHAAQDGGTKKYTIVGAGMAGLYAAWRLVVQSKHASTSDICILEMTDRIGGRLDTFTFPGGATWELGGMRFSPAQHTIVADLVKTFALKCVDFQETDNGLYYLRGKHIWQREMDKPGMLPYALTQAEQQKTPDALVNWAVGNAIGNPKEEWRKWDALKWKIFVEQHKYFSPSSNPVLVYNGASFSDVGFRDLLYDQLSNEGYCCVTDAGGYDSNTINWNSAIAMPYLTSGDYTTGSPIYQRIDGGYHKLPEALARALSEANVPISRNTRLVRFTNDGSGMIDCTFDLAGGQGQLQLKTEHLFLCIPPRSLELLDPNTDFAIQMRRNHYLESVIRQPSFKLLFLYKDRWYRKVQIRGQSIKPLGPTITDLPLRMIWYFDPDPTQPYWTLLASYCDMTSTEFWRVMEQAPPPPGYPGSRNPTKEMCEMARAQLQSVHNIDIPEPEDAVFQDWGLDPYGAGYHAWAAHYFPWNIFDRMLQPISSYNVYICGEAYSLDQGWVEGSLRTVDKCLDRFFKVKPHIESLSGIVPLSTSFGLRRL